jgi:hypothetical protein
MTYRSVHGDSSCFAKHGTHGLKNGELFRSTELVYAGEG